MNLENNNNKIENITFQELSYSIKVKPLDDLKKNFSVDIYYNFNSDSNIINELSIDTVMGDISFKQEYKTNSLDENNLDTKLYDMYLDYIYMNNNYLFDNLDEHIFQNHDGRIIELTGEYNTNLNYVSFLFEIDPIESQMINANAKFIDKESGEIFKSYDSKDAQNEYSIEFIRNDVYSFININYFPV